MIFTSFSCGKLATTRFIKVDSSIVTLLSLYFILFIFVSEGSYYTISKTSPLIALLPTPDHCLDLNDEIQPQYERNKLYSDNSFVLNNYGSSCSCIFIESRYTGAPPLIFATDQDGVRYFSIGRMIVSSNKGLELQIEIKFVKGGEWKWQLLPTYNATISQNNSIQFSSYDEYVSPIDSPTIITTEGCYPSIYSSFDQQLIMKYNAIPFSLNSGYLKKGEKIKIRHDLYNRKDIYHTSPCKYTIYLTKFVETSLPHLLSVKNDCGEILNIDSWVTPSIIQVNSSCDLYTAYGKLYKVDDNINIDSVYTPSMKESIYSYNRKIKNMYYTISDNNCIPKFIIDYPSEPTYKHCYSFIDRRCSYDVECPTSYCNTSTNRCYYNNSYILNCIIGNLTNHDSLKIKYNVSDLFSYFYNLYSYNYTESVSYKTDNSCLDACPSIFINSFLDDSLCSCPRIVIDALSYRNSKQCNVITPEYKSLCEVDISSHCSYCDGEICTTSSLTDYCHTECFSSNTALATQSNCYLYSGGYNASCIVNKLVVDPTICNTSSTCDIYSTLHFQACNNPISHKRLNANLIPYLGQSDPLRYATLQVRTPTMLNIDNRDRFNWGGLFIELSSIDNFFLSEVIRLSNVDNLVDTLIYYGEKKGVVNITNTLSFYSTNRVYLYVSAMGTMISFEGESDLIVCNVTCIFYSLNGTLSLGSLRSTCYKPITPVFNFYENLNITKNITITTQLVIYGNLSIQPDTIVTISPSSEPIKVDGCVFLNGTLNITEITEDKVLIMHQGCVKGDFNSIKMHESEDICKKGSIVYDKTTISVIFSMQCMLYVYILIGVLLFLIAITITIIVVYFKFKSVRKKIAPFHDRKPMSKRPLNKSINKIDGQSC